MRLLIIEDDKKVCDSLAFQLEKEGISVDPCYDGEEGLYWIRQGAHDLILLDCMLPGMNGITILNTLRKEGNSTPVILITALGETTDKIRGLDSGADDYIVKPFVFEELMARIRSIRRRPKVWEGNTICSYKDLTLDYEGRVLQNKDHACQLTKTESELMELFIRNPNIVLTRNILLFRVWGPDTEVEDGNLENYIYLLRRRIKSLKSNLGIKTIRGTGYQLEEINV